MQQAPPPAPGFPWRFVVYGALGLYLFVDLHLMHGPLRRHIESRRNPPPEAVGELRWVAAVNGKPITFGELERAVEIYFWKRGQTKADASDANLFLVRFTVREELVARRLISTYAGLNPVEVDPEIGRLEFERFRSRLDEEEDDYATRLELQGLDVATLKKQFADEAAETAWIDAKTATARAVTDEEVSGWFELNRGSLAIPERVRASHIFRTTHRIAEADIFSAGESLREAKRKIGAGEATFEEVAADLSEDERTKARGGNLGYFSKGRLPPGFTEKVFGQEVGVLGEPFRSEIGWHLVRVDEHLPARPAEFGEVEREIRAFLESEKRRAVVESLIKERRGFAKFRLFPLDGDPK